jgi:predicted flap endonuclease-1-like 5' DNA nuclease
MLGTRTGGGTSGVAQGEAGPDFPAGVSQPALRALHAAGYTRLEQLTTVTERDLLALHGLGPKAITVLRDALQRQGKSFATAKPQ